MKALVLSVGAALLALLTLLAALAWMSRADPLAVPEQFVFVLPQPKPPAELRMSVLHTGSVTSLGAFAYEGGKLFETRRFAMAPILVQHPQGRLLIDAGFGRDVAAHARTLPLLMRLTSVHEAETPAVEQLGRQHLGPTALKAIILTHAHWDHVSGLPDFPGVPVWLAQPEIDFIRSGHPGAALAHSLNDVAWTPIAFQEEPYLGFEQSLDVFGDGSVVLVPAPGHTPGSLIAFIHLPSGMSYALVGDLVWQLEGVELPAERPALARRMVDVAPEQVRNRIVHLHQLRRALPNLRIIPAHDQRVLEQLPAFPASVS